MISLTVPGDLDSLKQIGEYIKEVATAAHLDSSKTYKLRLAVDEIATNVITHGYTLAGRVGSLTLQSQLDENLLTIFLEDTGAHYEPGSMMVLEEESLNQPLDIRPVGGLGVFLAIQGVDRFVYERTEAINRHIFSVSRAPKRPA